MMWFCPNCKANTENDQCPQCGLPYAQGEATAATRLLKSVVGSTAFIVATVCITAAVLLSIVLSVIQYNPFSQENMDEAITSTISAVNYKMPEGTTVEDLITEINTLVKKDSNQGNISITIPFLAILAIVGCWLLIGQSSRKRIYVRSGGIVCLKIYYIFQLVCQSLLLVFDALLIFAMALFRQEIFNGIKTVEADYSTLAAVLKNIFMQSWFQLFSFIICGVFAIIILFGILFDASMIRTMNAIKYTSKTGNFTAKCASLFGAIIFILLFVLNISSGVFTLVFDMNMEGIATLLIGIADLLFAISMLSHRKKVGKIYAMYVDGVSYKDDYQYEDGIPEDASNYYDPSAPAPVVLEQDINLAPQEVSQPVIPAVMEQPEIPAQPVAVPQPPVAPPVMPVQTPTPIAPAQPVAPAVPAQPKPVAPEQPSAPAQPVVPVQPVAPAQPVAPVQPVAPAQPVAPVQPAAPQQPKQQQEFEAFFARQEAAAAQQAETQKQAAQASGKRCPRCGQPISNPYFCMNCGFRLK